MSNQTYTLDGITLASSKSVRALGGSFDQDVLDSVDTCERKQDCLQYLKLETSRLRVIKKTKIVHAFIRSRLDYCNLDYCNLLLSICSKCSQQILKFIQNSVTDHTSYSDHISLILASLYWFPNESTI